MLAYSAYSGRSLFYSRYLSFVQLDLLAALAVFVAGLAPLLRIAATAGGALLWGRSYFPVLGDSSVQRPEPGMRGAFEYIASMRHPGDMVIAENSFTFLSASYYGRHGTRPVLFSESLADRFMLQPRTWTTTTCSRPTSSSKTGQRACGGCQALLTGIKPASWFICQGTGSLWIAKNSIRITTGRGPVVLEYLRKG